MMLIESDAALARLLGLSPAAVCRAKKRGMPTGSLEAARRWRDENLNPAHRKDVNRIKGGSGYRGGFPDPRAAIKRVHALMDLLTPTIGTPTFAAMRPALVEAMRAVDVEHRPRVMLAMPVMDELLRPMLDLVREPQATRATDQAAAAELADDDAEVMGAFWYAMACGEPFPAALLAS